VQRRLAKKNETFRNHATKFEAGPNFVDHRDAVRLGRLAKRP